MLKAIMQRYRERSFVNNAMQETAHLIEELFHEHQPEELYVGIKTLKKKGAAEVEAFKKYLLNEVLRIVQSKNPVIALRKALIDNIQFERQSRMLLSGEFSTRRQVIYDELNALYGSNSGLRWSDPTVMTMAVWSEVEGICLRHLQTSMVEKGSDGDWWAAYSRDYTHYIENLYRSFLAKADGQRSSIYSLLVSGSYKAVENLEVKLTGAAQQAWQQ
jgi:hypothetical protein